MRFKLQVPCHSNFRTTVATLQRFLPLAAVALALIALSALAACGGGSDGDGGATQTQPATPVPTASGAGNDASPPTQPATPVPTASGAGSDASPPTQAPADSGPAPTTDSGTEELFVLSLDFESLELNLTAGDTVSVTYSAIGASTGGITTGGKGAEGGAGTATAEVTLTVLNPIEEQILIVEKMSSNTVEFQAELTGTYQMVFSNPFRLQALIVPVEYTINP